MEFGSGMSTLRLARAFSQATIISYESDPSYLKELTFKIEAEPECERIILHHSPLKWQKYRFYSYFSYAVDELPDSIDAVLIDGPPYWTLRGREACLHQVFSKLKPGGYVFLDDCNRSYEQQILKNWQLLYGDSIHISVEGSDKKNGIIRKEKN